MLNARSHEERMKRYEQREKIGSKDELTEAAVDGDVRLSLKTSFAYGV